MTRLGAGVGGGGGGRENGVSSLSGAAAQSCKAPGLRATGCVIFEFLWESFFFGECGFFLRGGGGDHRVLAYYLDWKKGLGCDPVIPL